MEEKALESGFALLQNMFYDNMSLKLILLRHCGAKKYVLAKGTPFAK